jgi:hypothetical protein
MRSGSSSIRRWPRLAFRRLKPSTRRTIMLATLPAGAPTRVEQIARLNDRARLGLDKSARIAVTRNCLATLGPIGPLAILNQARLLAAMRRCTFSADSPERDLGVFELEGTPSG